MTTQHTIRTFQNDALVETRELDLLTNTFTRRDSPGSIVEQRPLNDNETASLNNKADAVRRDANFEQAKSDARANAGVGDTTLRSVLTAIFDELEHLRS